MSTFTDYSNKIERRLVTSFKVINFFKLRSLRKGMNRIERYPSIPHGCSEHSFYVLAPDTTVNVVKLDRLIADACNGIHVAQYAIENEMDVSVLRDHLSMSCYVVNSCFWFSCNNKFVRQNHESHMNLTYCREAHELRTRVICDIVEIATLQISLLHSKLFFIDIINFLKK